MISKTELGRVSKEIPGGGSSSVTRWALVVWQLAYVAPLEIIGKIRRRAGDQTAEILPRLMMIELPCTGRRRDGRKRKRKGGLRGTQGREGDNLSREL